MFETIFNTIFPTFILIFIGWAYAYIRPEVSTKSLNHLALYVGMPAIIIRNIMAIDLASIEVGAVVWASVFTTVIPGIVGFAWIKIFKIKESGLVLPISFPNAVNLPLPVIQLAWGAAGVAIATIYFSVQFVFILIFSVLIIAPENKLKEVLKLPYVYILALALIMNWQNVVLPAAVDSLLAMCAEMAFPLMLIIIGIILYRSFRKVTSRSLRHSLIAALIRVLGGLITALAVVYLFGSTGLNRTIILFYGIMPGAILTTLFAEKFNRDSEVVSQSVFFATLISIMLIPVMLAVLM